MIPTTPRHWHLQELFPERESSDYAAMKSSRAWARSIASRNKSLKRLALEPTRLRRRKFFVMARRT